MVPHDVTDRNEITTAGANTAVVLCTCSVQENFPTHIEMFASLY